ncbi:YjgF-like protein [Flagelloscypha sp. PMI_526]|nr:YjgF-like protein [Flagelloscypha sp. PMI_526]
MATTQKHSTGNPYESKFGYSRAVRRGPFIFVSGTTSTCPETQKLLYPDSASQQAEFIFAEIIRAVEALGGSKNDIMRVRMFVRRDEDTGPVGSALKSSLGDVAPAATMIVGAKFVHQDMLVEIEADALVDG